MSGRGAEPFDGSTSRLLRQWGQFSRGFDFRGGGILDPRSVLGLGLLESLAGVCAVLFDVLVGQVIRHHGGKVCTGI